MAEREKVSKRQRASTYRSRTGCIICRSRHVKCDEKRPNCWNCQKSGNVCKYLTRHRCFSKNCCSPAEANLDSMTSLDQAVLLPEDTQQGRHLYFFQQQTIGEFCGCLNQEFWSRFLLQVSQSQPAVRHAIVAVGALHEHVQSGKAGLPNLKSYGLQQYNHAIEDLRQESARGCQQNVGATLICCLLFILFEALQENLEAISVNVAKGLDILKGWQNVLGHSESASSSPEAQLVRKDLIELYTRLDLQALFSLEGYQPRLVPSKLVPYKEIHSRMTIPSQFSAIDEAKNNLDVLMYLVYYTATSDQLSRHFSATTDIEAREYMEQWATAFDAFLGNSKMTPNETRICTILRVYHTLAGIMLATWLSTEESAYEPFLAEFQSIVELVEIIIDLSKDPGPSGFRPSLEIGAITPLCYVCSNCQSQSIRNRGLSLMLNCPRGIWSTIRGSWLAQSRK